MSNCLVIRVKARQSAFKPQMEFKDPFDSSVRDAMIQAMSFAAKDMQSFKLAYHQSDEATFLLTDFDKTTNGWFDYRRNKVVPDSGSAFTAAFNSFLAYQGYGYTRAIFDSRALIVPKEDAANIFVRRQKAWERSSLRMLAQHHFSNKQLHSKNSADMKDMLHDIGVSWEELELAWKRNGTFLTHDGQWISSKLDYNEINQIIFGEEDAESHHDSQAA